MYLARVRVSSQYFPVLYCISYRQLRKEEIVGLVVVRVSSG